MRHTSNRRRTGSVYLIVLGAAMLVTVLGVSALLAVRVHRHAAESSAEAVHARFAAESVIDLAAFRIAHDPNWRNTYTHDRWTPTETLRGTITFQYKLVDEEDGDLADDAADPVRLHARAAVGDARRIYSVLLTPDESSDGNLFANPGFEDGTAEWSGESPLDSSQSTLQTITDTPHGGNHALRVTNRSGQQAGPAYDLTNVLQNGKTYTIEVWARTLSGTETVGFERYTKSGTELSPSISKTSILTTSVGDEWTLVTDTFTPSWDGDLIEAYIKVRTGGGGAPDFDADDTRLLIQASGSTAMQIKHGTWRQEVSP